VLKALTADLFETVPDVRPPRETMADGAVLLRGFVKPFESELIASLREIVAQAPFRRMFTPGGASYDVFSELHQSWVKPGIEKILLGGANLMEVGEQGSYSAVVSQKDSGPSIIFRYDAQRIGESIDSQIFWPMLNSRWPGAAPTLLPHHVMEAKQEKDQKARMELITATAALVPVRKSDVYEEAGLTPPKPEEETVYTGGQQSLEDAMGMMPEPTVGPNGAVINPPKLGPDGKPLIGEHPTTPTAPPTPDKKPSEGTSRPGQPRRDGHARQPVGENGGAVADE
jgi:hypothetical protein